MYDGTHYVGWQIQPNGMSVQQKLTDAFSTVLNENIDITGCGRTDAGVHASHFVAHFDYSNKLTLAELEQLCFKLNRFLPNDISLQSIIPVDVNFHARFDATSRTYNYYISQKKNPFAINNSWFLYGPLNLELMNEASKKLFDFTDFSCFSKSKTQVKTNNCKIYEAYWTINEKGLLVFTIKADRFLRNMVRAIVGTLVEIGKKKKTIDDFVAIIESKNRSNAGSSVPAKGLFLSFVAYPNSADL